MTLHKDAADAIRAGVDVDTVLASARVVSAPPTLPRADSAVAADVADVARHLAGPRDAHGHLRFMDVGDYLASPELLEPPPVVVPHLAWQGRLTLLVADEKCGKSTFVGQAVAAMNHGGDFLGEAVDVGHVLWLALDEARGDVIRRLHGQGVVAGVTIEPYDGEDIHALPAEDRRVPSGLRLREAITSRRARLVVVDTLHQFVLRRDPTFDTNRPEGWITVLGELRDHAEATGAAFVLIHHANRSAAEAGKGRRYMGSVSIGGSVDVIADFTKGDGDERKLKLEGRGVQGFVRMAFTDGRYDRADGASGLADVGDIGASVDVAVRVLADAGTDGLTSTQWQRQWKEDAQRAGLPHSERHFYRTRATAVRHGLALQQAKRGRYVVLGAGVKRAA